MLKRVRPSPSLCLPRCADEDFSEGEKRRRRGDSRSAAASSGGASALDGVPEVVSPGVSCSVGHTRERPAETFRKQAAPGERQRADKS